MSKTKDIVGQVLNDTYRLTRKLDQGGMGAVYEAVQVRLTRKRFAIKVLRPEAAEEKELFARFRREAEMGADPPGSSSVKTPNLFTIRHLKVAQKSSVWICFYRSTCT